MNVFTQIISLLILLTIGCTINKKNKFPEYISVNINNSIAEKIPKLKPQSEEEYPKVNLNPPKKFKNDFKQYKKDHIYQNVRPYCYKYMPCEVTFSGGFYLPIKSYEFSSDRKSPKISDRGGWIISVNKGDYSEFASRYLTPTTPTQENLNRFSEYYSYDFNLKLKKKTYKWGEAITFVSKYLGDSVSNDLVNNNMIHYEVYGITKDAKHYVYAYFEIIHPKLNQKWMQLPYVEDRKKYSKKWDHFFENHASYKLVKNCDPEEFIPKFSEIDQLMNSLVFESNS
jgi:hypothetical protein